MPSSNLGNGKCTRETDKAILVELDGRGAALWIPKSVLHDDSEVFNSDENAEGCVIVKEWWAEKEGL